MPFAATWMDSDSIILSEANQTEKDKQNMVSLICESKMENDTNELIYKIETDNELNGYQGEGKAEGWIGSLGLTISQCYI